MTIICKSNTSESSPLILPRNNECNACSGDIVASSEWYTINSNISGYSISMGREYTVYGILYYDRQVRYLILDDYGMPGFFPSTLFQLQKRNLFFEWEIGEYSIGEQTLFIIAYPDICHSYDNLLRLVEAKSDAISNFIRNKDYIDRLDFYR